MDPVVVFGFSMGDRSHIINREFLEKKFPEIREYALDIVKGHLGEAVYGIACEIDRKTGVVSVEANDMEKMKELWDLIKVVQSHCTDLGYFCALYGDYQTCHEEILSIED